MGVCVCARVCVSARFSKGGWLKGKRKDNHKLTRYLVILNSPVFHPIFLPGKHQDGTSFLNKSVES